MRIDIQTEVDYNNCDTKVVELCKGKVKDMESVENIIQKRNIQLMSIVGYLCSVIVGIMAGTMVYDYVWTIEVEMNAFMPGLIAWGTAAVATAVLVMIVGLVAREPKAKVAKAEKAPRKKKA